MRPESLPSGYRITIDVDAGGNAIVVWQQENVPGGSFSLYANRFAAATKTWGPPVSLESNDVDSTINQDLDVDGAGNAVVVWTQRSSGGPDTLWSNRRTPSGSWGTALPVATATGYVGEARVAATGGGDALAVWAELVNNKTAVRASRFDASAGAWQAPMQLGQADTRRSYNPDIAADELGNAIVLWTEALNAPASGGTLFETKQVWEARWDGTARSWSTPEALNAPSGFYVSEPPSPKVALDPATGDGIAVWRQGVDTVLTLWASRYHRDARSWDAAVLVQANELVTASSPDVAIDASGNAVVVWQQFTGMELDVWANRFAASSGAWTGPVRLNVDSGLATIAKVAAGGVRDAVVVWTQRNGDVNHIRASRFDPVEGTWGVPSLLDTTAVPTDGAQVVMDSAGRAIAVWIEGGGSPFELQAAYHPM
jgi:hypothetical protein